LGLDDVEIIVKSLLLSLAAYRPGSSRGHTLLQVLLDCTASYLRTGLRSDDPTPLRSVRNYLDLVAFLVIEKQAAPAIQLLRFYLSHLSSRMILQKFPPDDQVSIICNLSETFVAADKDSQPRDDGLPLDALRKHVVDACPFLLEVRVPIFTKDVLLTRYSHYVNTACHIKEPWTHAPNCCLYACV
jgi:hypothetical protein